MHKFVSYMRILQAWLNLPNDGSSIYDDRWLYLPGCEGVKEGEEDDGDQDVEDRVHPQDVDVQVPVVKPEFQLL